MSELEVSPSELVDSATTLIAQASTAVDQVIATSLAVGAGAQSWGDDELGAIFEKVYVDPAAVSLEAVQQMAFHVADVAERLGQSGTSYAEAEETNTDHATAADPGAAQ